MAEWTHVRRIAGGASLVLASSCGQGLPSPSVLDKLRIITVEADPPEASPGTSIHVQAVWYDGSSRAGRPVYFLWRLCAAGSDTDPRGCLARANGVDVGVATAGGDQVTLDPASFPPPIAGTSSDVTRYTLLLAMCPSEAPVFDSTGGQYNCPSEASIPNDQREGIQASRILSFRTNPPLNHNPTIARGLIGGTDALAPGHAAITVMHCPATGDPATNCTGVPLVLYPESDAAETDAAGVRETLLASFYVTGGSTDKPRVVASTSQPVGADGSLTVLWYPPSQPGPAHVYFALHDGRGGNVAREADLTVQ